MAPDMKSALQRMFALVLALSLAPWSQGEICPMKMQAQQDAACATGNMHAHHAAQAAAKPNEHGCCPHGPTHPVPVHQQCPPVQFTACDSTMTCCAIHQQPSSSPQAGAAPEQPVVVPVTAVRLNVPARPVGGLNNLKISFDNLVFRLKEDLRI